MLKRHEIQVLRRPGHTLAEVATLSGVSVGTVRRVVDVGVVRALRECAQLLAPRRPLVSGAGPIPHRVLPPMEGARARSCWARYPEHLQKMVGR